MERMGWGNPNDSNFVRDNVATISRYHNNLRVTCHKVAKPLFVAVCDALVYEKGEHWLTVHRDEWGQFNRDIRNHPGEKSYHAWGLAVDLNATTNPSGGHHTDMPADAAALARAFGMEWGGTWHDPYDPMHFEQHGSHHDVNEKVRYLHSRLHEGMAHMMPVGVLQKSLHVYGYNPGPADSVFGGSTKAALNAFKKAHHLPANGICDNPVWHAMGFDQA